jgi:hypothetical protein
LALPLPLRGMKLTSIGIYIEQHGQVLLCPRTRYIHLQHLMKFIFPLEAPILLVKEIIRAKVKDGGKSASVPRLMLCRQNKARMLLITASQEKPIGHSS